MKWLACWLVFWLNPMLMSSQVSAPVTITISCDENSGCTHKYSNGELFKTIETADGIVVTVGLVESGDGKYFRLNVGVLNNSSAAFDLMPSSFVIEIPGPKSKLLYYIPPGNIAKSAERHASWVNYFTALGGGLATQKSTTHTTTRTSSSGRVNTQSSMGQETRGTYQGESSSSADSTTRSPDYEAQARAAERIRQRNAVVATMNERMMDTALTANTIAPGQSIAGYVYFKTATAATLHPKILVAGKVYEFEF